MDEYKIKKSFKSFVVKYRTALALLQEAVDELEEIYEGIAQKSSDIDKKEVGDDL